MIEPNVSNEGSVALPVDIPQLPGRSINSIDNYVNQPVLLSQIEQDLFDPTNRKLASETILKSVVNDKIKVSLPVIDVLSQILSDKSIELVTRYNAVKVLVLISKDNPQLMPILDKSLDNEDLNICKIIINKFINSDYKFNNVSAIENALFKPELKLWAIALLHKAVVSKYINTLQDSTISYLNTLLDDEDIEIKKYSVAIFTHCPNYLITNLKAIEKLITDKDLDVLSFKLLFNMAANNQLIDSSILDNLAKISSDKYIILTIRQYLLEILDLQISNSDDIAQFAGFSFLLANLGDENPKIVEKTIKIFKSGLDKVKLGSPKKLRDYAVVSKVMKQLTELSKQLPTDTELKQEISYCLNLILPISKQLGNKHEPQENSSNILEEISQGSADMINTIDNRETKHLNLILSEIEQLNQNNQELLNSLIVDDLLLSKFNEVISCYNSDSILMPIGEEIRNWQDVDIQNWSKKLLTKDHDKGLPENLLPEMIAIVKRANIITMDQDPRPVQILSILILMLSLENKGRLIQVSTGEGKSTTSAMLAAILALQGEKVDVITSSQVLAKRDSVERQEFFAVLNLTTMHNVDEQVNKGPKLCYKANIVYGDVGSFQYDLLKHEYKGYNTRGNRNFDNVIIDEVDSMLVDDNSKLARLASHIAGTEYLEPLLVAAWYELEKLDNHLLYLQEEGWVFIPGAFKYENGVLTVFNESNICEDSNESAVQNVYNIENKELFCQEHIVCYLTKIIENQLIKIPYHLEEFARNQIENWAKSAIQANHMAENKHYILLKNKEDHAIIAPVDYYNTGIIQENTKWNNGLHQFLQLKHSLKLSAEDFNTSFISNLTYFKRYGSKIFGMTGTLGSKYTQDLLTYIYPVDLAFVPTYKPKQFTEVTGILRDGQAEWLNAITEHLIEEVRNNRAVLIICETIGSVNKVEDKLLTAGYPANKIKRYSRNDNDEYLAIDTNVNSGEIIIATNLAGRGTDIKTSRMVEENGGLHVCVTFLPDNLRVEEQAFGRTSRQGKQGTAILIVDLQSEALLKLVGSNNVVDNIVDLKKLRNQVEYQKLQKVKDTEIDKIVTDDLLFSEFCKFIYQLKDKETNQYKLLQLDESWGLWLKQIQEELDKSLDISNEQKREYALSQLQIFKDKIGKQYFADYKIMRNPAYLIMEGFNTLGIGNRYQQSIDIFTLAVNLDRVYSFAALYNRAYANISQGYAISMQSGKFDSSWQNSAYQDLMMAKQQISAIVIPQLEAMQIVSNSLKNPTDSALCKQIVSKINLLKLQIKYIDSAADIIKHCKEGNITRIINVNLLRELINPSTPVEDEINELNMFGVHQLFEVEEVEPEDPGVGFLVMALGFAQIALGAFCVTVGTYKLGVWLIMEGMQDLYKSVQIMQGGQFSWDDYFIEKGVSIAASLAIQGLETVITSSKGATILAKEAIIKANVQQLMGKELAVQTIKEVAIKTAVNLGMDTVVNIISRETLREFKDDIKDNVGYKISQCLNQHSVQQQLTLILAIDGFNCNSNYREIINKIINDILSNKHNTIIDIVSKTIDSMTHSSNPTVKALGYISKGGKMANDLSKILDFVDNFCDDLVDRLNHLEQSLPILNDLLYQHMRPKLNRQDIDGIIQKLTQGSIVKDNQLVLTAIYAIDVIRFGEYEEHKVKVVELCKRLCTYFTMNYSSDINLLCQETAQKVTGRLMSKIQGQLMNPLVKVGTDHVSKIISDKLIHLSNKLNHTLQQRPSKQNLKIVGNDNKEIADYNNIVQENKQLQSDRAKDNTNPYSKNDVTKLKSVKASSSSSNQQDVNKPVSRADQNKQDEAKSMINYDDEPFNYSMLFLEKPETEQLKLLPININSQVFNFTEKDQMLPIYNDISSLIKDRPAGLQDNMTPFLSDLFNGLKVNSFSTDKGAKETFPSFNITLFGTEAQAASSTSTMGTVELSLPVFEAVALKHGPKVAKGFSKFAVKSITRVVPGIGICLLASDIVDGVLYIYNRLVIADTTTGTTHERRGDSVEVREQKNIAKQQITSEVIKLTIENGRCERLRALPVDELVQHFTNEADALVPNILDNYLPPIWNGENVIGILKHGVAHNLNMIHQEKCQDVRLKSEIHWRDKKPLDENTLSIIGGTKGSVRLDFKTTTKPNIVYDLKFGKQGITTRQLQKFIKHTETEDGVIIKEVRPSRLGGVTQIYPQVNQ